MITRLTGILLEKKAPNLVIDIQGVGYEVLAPMSTFYQLPELGDKITLLTHLSISENAHTLYGFFQPQERELFRALIKVNGVGPKLALTILSGIEPDEFVRCIQTQDTTSLINIPGIGKKTAERLIIETRDALSKWHTEQPAITQQATASTHQSSSIDDAISGLTALGYKPNDAKRAVNKVFNSTHSSEQLIRLALQQMVRRT